MSNWLPKETAPKTGETFIAWDRDGYPLYTMYWDEYEFLTENENWSGSFTHWQPRLKGPQNTLDPMINYVDELEAKLQRANADLVTAQESLNMFKQLIAIQRRDKDIQF